MSLDIQLSNEQQAVVDAIGNYNVIVDSVAGCGKTSTSLGICVKYPTSKVLIVTYNTKLRKETVARVERLNIGNVEIHTYHSLCTKYYMLSPTDVVMNKVCVNNMPPSREVPEFNIIILDESQDVDSICFTFIIKFMHDNCKQPGIAVFGDINQSIYGFKGSDYRYLTEAQKIYSRISNREWCQLHIHESFRVTKPIADFVNTQLLNNNRINSKKIGANVRYIFYDAFSRKGIIKQLGQTIRSNNWKPNEIFILSYSIRSQNKSSPVKILENQLVFEGFPCYVPIDDDSELDENVMRDKITFSSFHQAKGRERKVVFLLGFDERTYRFYVEEKKSPISSIINTYYVGLTRAMENLFILHHHKNGMFPTVNADALASCCDIISDKKYDFVEDAEVKNRMPNRGVKDILRFFTLDFTTDLLTHLKVEKVPLNKSVTNVRPYAVGAIGKENKQQYEAISDLYGVAITLFNEIKHDKDIPVGVKNITNKYDFKLEDVLPYLNFESVEETVEINRQRVSHFAYKYKDTNAFDFQKLLLLCNFIDSLRSGYISRWKQLTDYSFVDGPAITLSSDIIDEIVHTERIYEHKMCVIVDPLLKLTGFIDILAPVTNTIYEIKFTPETKPEHLFQLAIYGYMLDDVGGNSKPTAASAATTTLAAPEKPKHNLTLINVREGAMYNIVEFNRRAEFMKKIVDFNNRPELTTTLDQFLNHVNQIIDKIIGSVPGQKIIFENGPGAETSVCEAVNNSDLLAKLAKLKALNNKKNN